MTFTIAVTEQLPDGETVNHLVVSGRAEVVARLVSAEAIREALLGDDAVATVTAAALAESDDDQGDGAGEVKARRKRRTKAEIEQDRAIAAAKHAAGEGAITIAAPAPELPEARNAADPVIDPFAPAQT